MMTTNGPQADRALRCCAAGAAAGESTAVPAAGAADAPWRPDRAGVVITSPRQQGPQAAPRWGAAEPAPSEAGSRRGGWRTPRPVPNLPGSPVATAAAGPRGAPPR